MINVGIWIKAFRKEKGYTQKQLGDMVGLSSIAIQNYESGTRKPNVNVLYNISKALDIDISLFFKDSSSTEEITKDIVQKSYIGESLLSLYNSIDDYVYSANLISSKSTKEEVDILISKLKDLIDFERYKLIKLEDFEE